MLPVLNTNCPADIELIGTSRTPFVVAVSTKPSQPSGLAAGTVLSLQPSRERAQERQAAYAAAGARVFAHDARDYYFPGSRVLIRRGVHAGELGTVEKCTGYGDHGPGYLVILDHGRALIDNSSLTPPVVSRATTEVAGSSLRATHHRYNTRGARRILAGDATP